MMYSGRMGGGRNYGMASDEEIKNRPKVTRYDKREPKICQE